MTLFVTGYTTNKARWIYLWRVLVEIPYHWYGTCVGTKWYVLEYVRTLGMYHMCRYTVYTCTCTCTYSSTYAILEYQWYHMVLEYRQRCGMHTRVHVYQRLLVCVWRRRQYQLVGGRRPLHRGRGGVDAPYHTRLEPGAWLVLWVSNGEP